MIASDARMVVCLDGMDPAYLAAVETPGWDAVAAAGTEGECACVVPSLTNVNNVSIVTGAFPAQHGITGNSYYDRETGALVYMEDPSYLRQPTRLQAYSAAGETVAALVAKDKLKGMVGQDCAIAASAEDPPAWLEDAVGDVPDIYSGDASAWLLDAALYVLEARDPDVLYVSTTDVVPHKHAPDEEVAREWVRALDERLAAFVDAGCDVVATADHGMNRKTHCVDLEGALAEEGVDATVVRLIRDKHTYHHQNLGGAAYVYLHGATATDVEWLADLDGVDSALTREEAGARFRLPRERIGDLFVLGDARTVFGPVDGDVSLRSHGSAHERTVPYAATVPVDLDYNLEAFAALEGAE